MAIKEVGHVISSIGFHTSKLSNLETAGIRWSCLPFESPPLSSYQLVMSLKQSCDPSLAVKKCFLYCSPFPRSTILDGEEIVQLWMAQCFLTIPYHQSQSHKEMEELGNDYFDLLIQRYMLQVVEIEKGSRSSSSSITSCKMHKVVHEFACGLMGNFCLVTGAHERNHVALSSSTHVLWINKKRTGLRFKESLPRLRTRNLENSHFPNGLINIRVSETTKTANGCQILELGPLQSLKGELKIYHLENVKDGEEAWKADQSSKSEIRTLRLRWDVPSNRKGQSNEYIVMERLHPNPRLQHLSIINFDGSKFPSRIVQTRESSQLFRNLVSIKLGNCNRCTQIPQLGHLPSLKHMELGPFRMILTISPGCVRHPAAPTILPL
ncbi:OLC1v1000677C1 [Oldenlandia corymbosa var. corymbosa]|uniref:OLC1v1000677C1 n=1 Tax=Oldenlandia corymbosa var. corymbosa TaxID=529605 RepID=A0AAV1D3S9_OLDCO|nr:OLC1v1000677C1 [Oldenlandia corymbosa var. corymbosa]